MEYGRDSISRDERRGFAVVDDPSFNLGPAEDWQASCIWAFKEVDMAISFARIPLDFNTIGAFLILLADRE